jgi:hypothetical protein
MGQSKKFHQKKKPFNRQPGVYQTVKPEKILSLKEEHDDKPVIKPIVESNRLSDVFKKPLQNTLIHKDLANKDLMNKDLMKNDDNKSLDPLFAEQKTIMHDFDKMEQNLRQKEKENKPSIYPTTFPKELDIVPYKRETPVKNLDIVPYKRDEPVKREEPFKREEGFKRVEPVKKDEPVKKVDIFPHGENIEQVSGVIGKEFNEVVKGKEFGEKEFMKGLKPGVVKKKNTKKNDKVCTNQSKTIVYEKNVSDGSKDKYYVMKQVYRKCQKKTAKKRSNGNKKLVNALE